jgi:NAD(P)-dependent dehydrogenase (short-subunit alcohol dehydrogenase family)
VPGKKTVIVTGASQGIGAAIVQAFLGHGDNVVATSRTATISEPKDIAEAVVYLTEASHVTGEVLHVDDGAQVGRW